MSDEAIPDDIMAKAIEVRDLMWMHSNPKAAANAVAEALLSERRQCADIAYDAALYSGCPADFIAEEIAEAVRNGLRPNASSSAD